jgi:uncharacterized protein (TIGR03067 family)
MRSKFFFLLLCFSSVVTNNVAAQSNPLNGAWIPVKQEFGGQPLPAASFDKQKLTISDSAYTFVAESVDKGVVRYSGDRMDIYGKEGVNAGRHITAIYKFENGDLSICYNLKGDVYPESFDTKGKPMYFSCVLKREGTK